MTASSFRLGSYAKLLALVNSAMHAKAAQRTSNSGLFFPKLIMGGLYKYLWFFRRSRGRADGQDKAGQQTYKHGDDSSVYIT
jgi:hypothetical protein